MPAGRRERRLARAVALVSVVMFLAATPFAKMPLVQVWAFIPIYESVVVINDLITAVLLFGQFSILRSRALLVLASGYLFTAFTAISHALTFPGLFSPTGLLGAGPQSTAWLYMFWHGGFPLFVLAYALLKDDVDEASRTSTRQRGRAGATILAGVAAVFAVVCGLTLVATTGRDFLPAIMQGNRYSPAMTIVVSSVWMMNLIALASLWRRRPHTVLDMWLMVAMCAWLFDIALAAVLNAGRFDLGFYAGRIYGLLAASFLLAVLLIENGRLYARLAEANAGERHERQLVQEKTAKLMAVNEELEAFSYSVSHDLRGPLRSMDGFSLVLIEDYGDKLDQEGKDALERIRAASQRMGHLIDDLLRLSQVTRAELDIRQVDLSVLARGIADAIDQEQPGRTVEWAIEPGLSIRADPALMRIAMQNLLQNAWKFSGRANRPVIRVGALQRDSKTVYFVADNGVGFDMAHAGSLFGAFHRLHHVDDFPGTGIGLAIVQRIIRRHGGQIRAEAKEGEGATFFFSLAASKGGSDEQDSPAG
jgi:signal transduction histidine kinase